MNMCCFGCLIFLMFEHCCINMYCFGCLAFLMHVFCILVIVPVQNSLASDKERGTLKASRHTYKLTNKLKQNPYLCGDPLEF